jgi:DNA-binding HxlR family transcriptional regulator
MRHAHRTCNGDLEVVENMREPDSICIEQMSGVIKLLQGKWTIQILCEMREHPTRLSELQRLIPTASKKALTASLRSLEAKRIVLRRDLSSSVLYVEYELAENMRGPLLGLLNSLRNGVAYMTQRMPENSMETRPILIERSKYPKFFQRC